MAEGTYPEGLLYHEQHDWAKLDDGNETATFGITWFAQDSLGEVVFFEPPKIGQALSKDEAYAEVESVKAVSEVIAPLSGEVIEVNEALADDAGAINADPYGEGWLVKVRLSDRGEQSELMDARSYRESLR